MWVLHSITPGDASTSWRLSIASLYPRTARSRNWIWSLYLDYVRNQEMKFQSRADQLRRTRVAVSPARRSLAKHVIGQLSVWSRVLCSDFARGRPCARYRRNPPAISTRNPTDVYLEEPTFYITFIAVNNIVPFNVHGARRRQPVSRFSHIDVHISAQFQCQRMVLKFRNNRILASSTVSHFGIQCLELVTKQ